MSAQHVSSVCKRVVFDFPRVHLASFDYRLIIFSPSVEILKNGPKLRKATEILGLGGIYFNYQDSIATVDGLDLTVASIQSEGETANFRPSFFSTRSFAFGTKHAWTNAHLHRDPKIQPSSHVYCRGRYCNYSYEMVDRLMAEQLWPAGGPPLLFADIEFIVAGVAFKAHRAIVCARSPVFAAMFASGMRESETGRVEITDVSPETFADFLKFVYTGQLDTPCFANSELGYCADKYEVKTLTDLCNGSTERDDFDAFMAALECYEDGPATTYETDAFYCYIFL